MKNTTQLQVAKEKKGKKTTDARPGNLALDLGQLYLLLYIRGPQSLDCGPLSGSRKWRASACMRAHPCLHEQQASVYAHAPFGEWQVHVPAAHTN